MLNLNKSEVISELKTNKYLNVFLVASPILAIITRMIIESLNLQDKYDCLSTGGGSLLSYLEGTPLPILDKLKL